MPQDETMQKGGGEAPSEKSGKRKKKERCLLVSADKRGMHKMPLLNFLRVLVYPFHALIMPFRMHGAKKVGAGPFVYVGNHFTLWDVIFPARTTWDGMHFVAKKSVFSMPVIGFFARRLGVIGARRDGSDTQTLIDSMKVLRNGEKLVIFPEGTRNRGPEDEFLPFNGGAALLAIKTRTPVIPFVVCNRPKAFRRVHVVFGEPFEFSEYYDRKLTKEDYEEADRKLRERMYEMRREFFAAREEKKRKKKKRRAKSGEEAAACK